jgi:predicted Zn-dependent protease
MYLPLSKSWTAFSIAELPSDEEVIQTAEEMSRTLSALKLAPVVEAYTGPAILSPEAAGVFFHEIFGHRVEGSRLKQETDAQTFKKKIGEPVLPKHLSVTFDPTQKYFQQTPLAGTYSFDDEGISAQRVEVVKNGILKNFLMSRTPIEGFSHSNGHGRASAGYSSVSRQSNMFIDSSQKFSEEELINKLKKETKAQGKEYAYYFKDVSGGFTNTGRYSPNSFNVTPLVVYRIYADNRPDELVRGVDMVGTPLAMFSQIEACGKEYAVFNGVCGAESGNIPVACVAPALFVKQIETQKRPKNQTQPPLLTKPQASNTNPNLPADEIILKAIKEEVNRGLNHLKMEGLQAPFFIAYTIGDMKRMDVSASNGSLMTSDIGRSRLSNTRMLIGDYQCTDENFSGSGVGRGYYDGSPALDNDEKALKNTVWKDLDALYKSAVETYEQKMAAIQQLNIPKEELELPDWDKTTPVVMKNIPRQHFDFDKPKYEQYVKEASSVFNHYNEVLFSTLALRAVEATAYFYNTEGTEFIYPMSFAYINGGVSGKTKDGEDIAASFSHVYSHPEQLPSLDDMKKECHRLAQNLIEDINAPKLKESYSGPVLYEGEAVSTTYYSNFFGGDISLFAARKPLSVNGYSYGGNPIEEMMNKRITAREMTIEDLTGSKEYKGTKLLGYAPIDGQGVVPPEKITLVENGILKTLLSDRIPTPKVPHSNGHALISAYFSSSLSTGVVRFSDTRLKSSDELKKELLQRAKEEGYEYAYIVRKAVQGGSYPIELYRISMDGSEERMRSAIIKNVTSEIFKKVVAVSDKEKIYNTFDGNLLTIISPDAVLFEEMQVQSDRIDNFIKAPLVPVEFFQQTINN